MALRVLRRLQPGSLLHQQQRVLSSVAATTAAEGTQVPFRYVIVRPEMMTAEEASARDLPDNLRPIVDQLNAMGGVGARPGSMGALRAARDAAAGAGQPLVLLHASGGTESVALRMVQAYAGAFHHPCPYDQKKVGKRAGGTMESKPPVLLLAHPHANSLPAALETLARLQQDSQPGRILYLPSSADAAGAGTDSSSGWASLRSALHSVNVWHQLQHSRIGLVGKPSRWLVASVPDTADVQANWGPALVDITMEDLMSKVAEWNASLAENIESPELQEAIGDLLQSRGSHAEKCSPPNPGTVAPAAAVYLALRDLVRQHGLTSVSVRCFDIVSELKSSGCYALARLLDEGVIAGCEGDVCAALSMLFGKLMTGQVPWMANLAEVDVAEGSISLAHCTVARSLLSEYEPTTHFESGVGVSLRGSFEPGPVTLLRVGGRDASQLWAEEGYLHRQPEGPGAFNTHLCRTQAHVRLLGGRDSVEALLRHPLGNHVVLLRGHWKAALMDYHSMFGAGVVAEK